MFRIIPYHSNPILKSPLLESLLTNYMVRSLQSSLKRGSTVNQSNLPSLCAYPYNKNSTKIVLYKLTWILILLCKTSKKTHWKLCLRNVLKISSKVQIRVPCLTVMHYRFSVFGHHKGINFREN